MNSNQLCLHTIGTVHSPFKEKFGVPRQPGLVEGNIGRIELLAPWNREESLQGLEGFTHLWVIFIFHRSIKPDAVWRPTVRPPREGTKRQGVFATRSPYRPNPIGLSVLKYHDWIKENGKLYLNVSDLDLIDGTPVIDIKPYLPYADNISNATGGFAHQAPKAADVAVIFTDKALDQIKRLNKKYPQLQVLIETTLKHNPRPAYFGSIDKRKTFGIKLYEFNVKWQFENSSITVLLLEPIP
ncbi:tRNA (N6-threonylcarbamoyladenosine(37)-N6)-methyltransferase TrmO [Thiomicrorhabdus arctica]|jgi:tRNA-Thr(GGU) m(6)t(6)A37 methyltransferase TsaA|uniref:tRNA (N6-threonylcarbamoyladenosine(37)-N6)-methyltransferase TrmO n=1 Tax=Thiomicrorhabdus arctica TaxID=131540 RepID=UPI0003732B4A|nr:tRNA (N6-threonylcarbamoyladenosine(37)-N6)-methyltransferase TrmO [Thiomicrorhabdus arctica]